MQKMGTMSGSAEPPMGKLAPPFSLELHEEATCRRWTFGSTKGGSAEPHMVTPGHDISAHESYQHTQGRSGQMEHMHGSAEPCMGPTGLW